MRASTRRGLLLSVLVCAVAAIGLPSAALADDELRVYMMASGSKDEVAALETELGYFRSEVTRLSKLTFTADKEIDTVIATCRESIGVSANEERDCRLQAARRIMVGQVVEVAGVKRGKRGWVVWVRAMDAEGTLLFEEYEEVAEKDLRSAARTALPTLAKRYLCRAHGVAAACPSSTGAGASAVAVVTVGTTELSATPPAADGARGGRLELLDVSPSPLSVWIGGQKIGLAPGQFRDLPQGELEVTMQAEGYTAQTRTVTLGGQMVTVSGVRLEALPGQLVVWSNVEGAEVKVNGVARGTTVGDAEVTLELAPGTVEIAVARTGYGTVKQQVTLAPGATFRVEARLEVRTEPDVSAGYVRIEPGSFSMGSPASEEDRGSDETQHTVTITRAFLLKSTEVTQGEWEALMGGNPSYFGQCGSDCPVEQVSWYSAVAYANALSKAEGLEECYALSGCSGDVNSDYTCNEVRFAGLVCAGYRLPTEAEWEYAARAGTTGARHGTLDAVAWYDGNSGSETHSVGSKSPNAWGLYDLLGNVWEWNGDWYGDYRGATTDPVGPESGSNRVYRGGGWDAGAQYARAANRINAPANRHVYLGFRPARSIR